MNILKLTTISYFNASHCRNVSNPYSVKTPATDTVLPYFVHSLFNNIFPALDPLFTLKPVVRIDCSVYRKKCLSNSISPAKSLLIFSPFQHNQKVSQEYYSLAKYPITHMLTSEMLFLMSIHRMKVYLWNRATLLLHVFVFF